MKVVTTEKIPVSLSLSEAEALVTAFTAACNFVAESSKEFKRRKNSLALHHEFYQTVREKYELSAQYTCSVFRVVAGKWKVSKNTTPFFRREYPTLQHGKDFSFTSRGLTISTMSGRKRVTWGDNGGRFVPEGLGAAKLLISKGKVYLAITVAQEVEEKPEGKVLGVDVGVRHAAVTSQRGFIDVSSAYLSKRKHYRSKRSELQSKKDTGKNTRGVRRALKRLSGREARLTRNEMHVVSKRLVSHAISQGVGRVAFEDVTGIRKGRWNHGWSNYMLRSFATYKLAREGIITELVDARYTSQMCSRCGHTEKTNRKGAHFECKLCGYRLDSDLNAAYNIRNRSIFETANRSVGQVPDAPGCRQPAPDVREGSIETQLSPVDKPPALAGGS